MLIKTVDLPTETPWRVDHPLEVVFLSAALSPDDAPRHLRDALAELYPREGVPRLRLVS